MYEEMGLARGKEEEGYVSLVPDDGLLRSCMRIAGMKRLEVLFNMTGPHSNYIFAKEINLQRVPCV